MRERAEAESASHPSIANLMRLFSHQRHLCHLARLYAINYSTKVIGADAVYP